MRPTIFTVLALSIVQLGFSQNGKDSATAVGEKFKTNGGREFWMGSNYRNEWNTQLKVPVLNLATEHGGLTPDKRGGGKQTKSLHLVDPNGREYTLRSVAKFITSKTLPGDLQSQAAADLVSDGVSASYPYAALSVAVLAEAANLPHGHPRVVYIGDDPRLGEYRKDFANTLVFYEERMPDSIDKVYNTEDVMDKLDKDNDNNVDEKSLLRIRVLDMFIMDFDRHELQWSWGAYEHGKGRMFYPLAKDRDQAFFINRGVIPHIVAGKSVAPQIEGFKAKAKNINRFNTAARNFDRAFLGQPNEQDWKNAVDEFLPKMTDAVIDNAMAQQPPEIRPSALKIAAILKERRKYLADEVMQYYRFLSRYVSITGSDKKELFEITRNDNGTVLVQVFKTNKDGDKSVMMYNRLFDPAVTKEIRLYGKDGNDRFVITGKNSPIKIRMIGGDGKDYFKNSTNEKKNLFVYDRRDQKNTLEGPFKNRMSNDSLVNNYEWKDNKYNLSSVFITAGYDPDDGVLFGPTLKIVHHGFRKDPYKSVHQLKALYAFSTKATRVNYYNEFIGALGRKTDLVTNFNYMGPNATTNFFGYGSNSIYNKSNPGNKFRYYRARYDLGDLSFQLRHWFSDKVQFSIGPEFQFYSLDSTDNLNKKRAITQNTLGEGLNPATLYRRQTYLGGTTSLSIDSRNDEHLPSKGIYWSNTFSGLRGMNNNSYGFVGIFNSDFSFYVTLAKDRLVWADRFGGGTTAGNGFEFFQAQYLGNDDNLRGYRKYRFAGKSKLYNQAELRWKLANLKTYLFPAAFGIFAFFDAGNVYMPGYPSGSFHTGYGGGLWFSPLRRIVFDFTYGRSTEDQLIAFKIGWKF